MAAVPEVNCVFCGSPVLIGVNGNNLAGKGFNTARESAEKRGDLALQQRLSESEEKFSTHTSCYRDYTNKNRLKRLMQPESSFEQSASLPKSLRSSVDVFNWKHHCFLCGLPAVVDTRHPDRNDTFSARTLPMVKNIMNVCDSRNDSWGLEVKGRISIISDLVSAEAVYHRQCYCKFYKLNSAKPTLSSKSPSDIAIGRPIDQQKQQAFETMCVSLEQSKDELITLDEVIVKMASISDEIYSKKQTQRNLETKYGSHISISSVDGRPNVICFKNMASRIITDKWYEERDSNSENESTRIVTAAAKLIRSEIREMDCNTANYPGKETFSGVSSAKAWVPKLLQVLMAELITDERKEVSLSHAIVQAARPRSIIAPILFGVGVSVDHKTGSKLLMNCLARLGFAISYDEVARFKQSAAQSEDGISPPVFPGYFTQWSGDNVDHNVCSLDGKDDNLHAMGIISMSVASDMVAYGSMAELPIRRLPRRRVGDLSFNIGVPFMSYTAPEISSLSVIKFDPILALQFPHVLPLSTNLELVWHVGWFFSDEEQPRANWSGFMHDLTVPSSASYSSADIRMLPIIDVNPNDRSCIFSTLSFVEKQAALLGMPTACITFDQPLWLKAVEISTTEKMNVFCRLGGFHTLMNFLGAIGCIMAGSGLAEGFEVCYGPVSVTHMMTGKAYAKAMRAHLLTESALTIKLLQMINEKDIRSLADVYWSVITKTSNYSDEGWPDDLLRLEETLSALKIHLSDQSRTARLWLQYMYYVNVAKNFVRAERTSDWNLHLVSLSQMLNLFAASGHRNYAKCGRLYLQMMVNLPTTNQWLHDRLSSGFHSVRRSDRFWTGLSTDLIIEQVMMRSLKTSGGLTRGRGVNDSVRDLWVCSMHSCASVFSGISSLADLEASSDEVIHIDTTRARLKRDFIDMKRLLSHYTSNNPFEIGQGELHSLYSGVTASVEDRVNCDEAEVLGRSLMVGMDNGIFADVKLTKAGRAKTLNHINKVVVVDKPLKVDSNLLFGRLLLIAQRREEIESIFRHELTSLPAAFFNGGVMRKTAKSLLARELKNTVKLPFTCLEPRKNYVVDGGWLLHKVKWQATGTYGDVLDQYVYYVAHHFTSQATVVFDGYGNGPSTKDQEHDRRSVKSAPNILVQNNVKAHCHMSSFLANEHNKKQFVLLLIARLEAVGHRIFQATSDADTLIVEKTLEFATSDRPVTTVANDTDILVLLLYHFHTDMADIALRSDTKNESTSVVSIRSIHQAIGAVAAKKLLVIHALGGCDTTSAVYGRTKVKMWRILSKSKPAESLITVLGCDDASHESVERAGLELMALLYGDKIGQSLNNMRYKAYLNMLTSGTRQPQPERLPPTEGATKFHVFRVHVQVIQWKSLMRSSIREEDWGWQVRNAKYYPIATDVAAAPDDMLLIIRCKCQAESANPCGIMCSCRRNGLKCVAACKNCSGTSCTNSESVDSQGEETGSAYHDLQSNGEEFPDDCIDFFVPWLDEEIVESSN